MACHCDRQIVAQEAVTHFLDCGHRGEAPSTIAANPSPPVTRSSDCPSKLLSEMTRNHSGADVSACAAPAKDDIATPAASTTFKLLLILAPPKAMSRPVASKICGTFNPRAADMA